MIDYCRGRREGWNSHLTAYCSFKIEDSCSESFSSGTGSWVLFPTPERLYLLVLQVRLANRNNPLMEALGSRQQILRHAFRLLMRAEGTRI